MLRLRDTLPDLLLREAAVELCLIIPAKLDVLLPHLGSLMPAIIAALQSKLDKSEIVLVG